jgi:hypothetical protein
MKWLLVILTVFAFCATAADISGTWKGTAETQNGAIERTFIFKVDGSKLTGETTSQMLGKSVIENGKIEGDTLSFTIKAKFQDNEMTLKYTGKVEGDQIKLHVESSEGGFSLDYVAKRVS